MAAVRITVLISLFSLSIAIIQLNHKVVPREIESEAILIILKHVGSNKSCSLRLFTTGLEVNSSIHGNAHPDNESDSLHFLTSAFHYSLVPLTTAHKSIAREPKRLNRAKLLAAKLRKRLQETTTSPSRFLQCTATAILVSPSTSNLTLVLENDEHYVRENDKSFFIGTEQVLKQVFSTIQVQRLRWPVGIILHPGSEAKNALSDHTETQTRISTCVDAKAFLSFHQCCKNPNKSATAQFVNKGSATCLRGGHFSTVASSVGVVVDEKGKIRKGLPIKFIEVISKFYNFTYSLVLAPSESRLETRKRLIQHQYDIQLGATQYIGNDEFTSASPAIDYMGISFFTAYPKTEISNEALLYPFESRIWLLLALSFVALMLSFFCALETSKSQELGTWTMRRKLFQSFWTAYMIIFKQPHPNPGHHISAIVQLLAILAAVMFLVTETAYTSDLVSYLAIPEVVSMPRNFEELSARKDFRIKFAHNSGPGFQFFQYTSSAVYTDIAKRYESVNVTTGPCLIDALRRMDTACMAYDQLGWIFISRNLTLVKNQCPLMKSKEPALRIPIVFLYPKFHKFSYEFDRMVGKLAHSGLFLVWTRDIYEHLKGISIKWIQRPENKHIRDLVEASLQLKVPFQPFPFREVETVCWIYMTGLGMGFTVFMAEVTWNLFQRKRGKKESK